MHKQSIYKDKKLGSNFKDFTKEDFEQFLLDYKLTFVICEQISHGVKRWAEDVYEETVFIRNKIKEFLVENYHKDLAPSPTQSKLWLLLTQDDTLNPNKLDRWTFTDQFYTSKERNKKSKLELSQLKNKGKYHVNQGGKFGKK